MTLERIGYPLVIIASIVAIWVWLRKPTAAPVVIQQNGDPNFLGAGTAPITAYVTHVPDYLTYNVAGVGLHTRAAMMAESQALKSECGCQHKKPVCGDPNQRLRDAYSGPSLNIHPTPA